MATGKFKKLFWKIIYISGAAKIVRYCLQRNKVSIFLLHDIGYDEADELFSKLKTKYNFISLQDFMEKKKRQNDWKNLPKYPAIMTFDDGHVSNVQLLPLFEKHKLPTTIFLCSSIVGTNRHFWGKYPMSKKENWRIKKLPNEEMLSFLKTMGYDKEKDYGDRHALNAREISEMRKSNWVDFQSHTRFHPILPNTNDEVCKEEIVNSKKELEKAFGLQINSFAYPNGDYTEREIKLVEENGYTNAMTVDYGYNDYQTNNYRLKRICLNDYGTTHENVIKATGLWELIKKVMP